MPGNKTVQKQVRSAERRRLGNKSVRTLCKSKITKVEKLIGTNKLDAAQEAAADAIRSLDKAAEKGILHPNNAARRKSRLMKKLNQALAAAQAKPEEAK